MNRQIIPDRCEHEAFWWECLDCLSGSHALRRAEVARRLDEATSNLAFLRLVYADVRVRRVPWWRPRARRAAIAERARIEAEVEAARDRLACGDYLREVP